MLSSLSATTVVVLPSESVPSSLSSPPPQILRLNHRNLHARARQLTYLLYTAAAITTHAPHQYTHSNFFLCYSTKNSPFTAISQTAADFLTSRTTSRTLLKTLQNVVKQTPHRNRNNRESAVNTSWFSLSSHVTWHLKLLVYTVESFPCVPTPRTIAPNHTFPTY